MGCMDVWVSSVANIKLLFIQLLLSDVTITIRVQLAYLPV